MTELPERKPKNPTHGGNVAEDSTAILDVPPAMNWDDWTSPFLFFTGKGGVGKTTIASTVAVRLADAGRRVLLVSTDPASNLGDVFGVTVGDEPRDVPGVTGLRIVNIDPHQAAADYRERVVGPYRGSVPPEQIRSMEEQLSGACTVEIASFDAFTRLVVAPDFERPFDHVVFDTAPTGHTLRLLSLPRAWSSFIESNRNGASCLGPLAGLSEQRDRYVATVDALADPERTSLVLVSRPEVSALREAARAGAELSALGMRNQRLILNGVLYGPSNDDRVANELIRSQREAVNGLPEGLRDLPTTAVPLVANDLTGVGALRALAHPEANSRQSPPPRISPEPHYAGIDELVDALEAEGPGVIMTMGKGGVGKTTVAAALAVALAERGHQVHLSTTDPAAHLIDALGDLAPETLAVTRIDPVSEVQHYTHDVIQGGRRYFAGRTRAARGGSSFALHGGDRRLPRIFSHARTGTSRLRGARYGANRPHAPLARYDRRLSSRDFAQFLEHVRAIDDAADASARSLIRAHC